MFMPFEDTFAELDRMLVSHSTDYEKMRAILQTIRESHELVRVMGPALDRLYASIARGHRKALTALEVGDTSAAMRESAKAVAWFYVRFQGANPDALPQIPQVAEELRSVRELAARSEILRDAVSQTKGHELYDP